MTSHTIKTTVNSVKSSPIWRKLPRELLEAILLQALHFYGKSDPIWVWALRDLSRVYRRQLDSYFFTHWLPKLTVNIAFSDKFEDQYFYKTVTESRISDCEYLMRRRIELPSPRRRTVCLMLMSVDGPTASLRKAFQSTSYEDEWLLSPRTLLKRVRGGYQTDGSMLPKLTIAPDGDSVRCDWRRLLTMVAKRAWQGHVSGKGDWDVRWSDKYIVIDVKLFRKLTGGCYCSVRQRRVGRLHVRSINCV